MNALNRKRIRNAKAALRSYIRARRYSDVAESDLTDLITDVYHLAQSEDVDVEVIARQALAHFQGGAVADCLSFRMISLRLPLLCVNGSST